MTLKQGLIVGATAAFVGLGWFAWREHDSAVAEHARADAEANNARLAQATTNTIDHYHETSRVIVQKAEQSADAVQNLPGAETPLDPALRDGWRAGIVGLRSGPSAPVDNGAPKPAG